MSSAQYQGFPCARQLEEKTASSSKFRRFIVASFLSGLGYRPDRGTITRSSPAPTSTCGFTAISRQDKSDSGPHAALQPAPYSFSTSASGLPLSPPVASLLVASILYASGPLSNCEQTQQLAVNTGRVLLNKSSIGLSSAPT